MPCREIQIVAVDLANADPVIVGEILAEMGLAGASSNTQVLLQGASAQDVALFKQKYAYKSTQRAAKKFGWRLEVDKANPRKLKLRR